MILVIICYILLLFHSLFQTTKVVASEAAAIPEKIKYQVLYYKRSHGIGMRQRLNRIQGRQVLHFGGQWCTLPKKRMKEIGHIVKQKMETEPHTYASIKKWANAALREAMGE